MGDTFYPSYAVLTLLTHEKEHAIWTFHIWIHKIVFRDSLLP